MQAARIFAYALLLLPVAELIAFVAVAEFIGFGAAIALLALLSLAGVVVLRRVGKGALGRLRSGTLFSRREAGLLDGDIGAALGAVLMVVPGFVTGLIGIALVVSPVRRKVIEASRRSMLRHRRPQPGILDLTPDEWQRLPGAPPDPDRRLH